MQLTTHHIQDSPGFRLWRAQNRWHREIRMALRPLDLTQSQMVLLLSLLELKLAGKYPTQNELAAHAMVDTVSTSTLLKALESRALVKRLQRSRDKRMWHLEITESGEKLIRAAVGEVRKFDKAFFSRIPHSQLDEFLRVCRMLS